MTREYGLKQDAIASLLNISVSTVKNHMTQALRTIRQEMRHFYHPAWLLVMLKMAWLLSVLHDLGNYI
jgi:hypothetical protein